MENYRSSRSKRVAASRSHVSAFGVSAHRHRNSESRRRAKPPLIEIELCDGSSQFQPGDYLMCEYRLRGIEGLDVTSLEASVIWVTEGKGSEDIGVHFFQRITKDALTRSTVATPKRLSTVLPNSPLSYAGEIVKVRWVVRIRMFYAEEQEISRDLEFELGTAVIPTVVADDEDAVDKTEA